MHLAQISFSRKNENIVSRDSHKWTLEEISIEIMIYLW